MFRCEGRQFIGSCLLGGRLCTIVVLFTQTYLPIMATYRPTFNIQPKPTTTLRADWAVRNGAGAKIRVLLLLVMSLVEFGGVGEMERD